MWWRKAAAALLAVFFYSGRQCFGQGTGTIEDNAPKSHNTRKVLLKDGDIIIGALFPVHYQPSSGTKEYTRTCGKVWEQYGMHRIETFVYTMKKINEDNKILPNITLGYHIRDSCWFPPIAMEQSIDFIKNSIASLDRAANKSIAGSCAAEENDVKLKPIVGLIGPGSSDVTTQVQNVLQLFNIPEIGYSATSSGLSDKALYKYFMRVVPPDLFQARALADLVKYFNWTFISTVHTTGIYGESGIQELKNIIKKDGQACIASNQEVSPTATNDEVDAVIKALKVTKTANVVLCFCQGDTVRKLLQSTDRLGIRGHFLFVGSDGWNDRPDVVEDVHEAAAGGISIRLYSPPLSWFDDHYFSLTPENNKWNPWFKQFWQEEFSCHLEGPEKNIAYKEKCSGKILDRDDYKQDGKLGFVINAIYTMAYALHNMQQDLCKGHVGICDAMSPVNGSLFLQYLFNVSFMTYSNDSLMFNKNGDPPGRYDIMNYQRKIGRNNTIFYDYERVGRWDSGKLRMDGETKIYWPKGQPTIESVCSQPCERGTIKKIIAGGVHCCWECHPCNENAILLDEETCQSCQEGWWPNADLSACEPIPIEYLTWTDTEAIVAVSITVVGLLMTAFIAYTFIRNNDTPVVKASTRELSYIILLGIVIAYLTTFPMIAKPSIFTCYLTRILPGLAFAMIYGALATKTNRISRILSGSKKKILTRKPRFMSASAQVIITFIIVGLECILLTAILIYQPADSDLEINGKSVKLVCITDIYGLAIPLGFDFLLIVICTFYAIKTRNLPENFNEAKFIGFTMYTTCVIWVSCVPIYFGSDSKVVSLCIAISICATVALVLLFWPKVYIIIWKPEKNQRSAFTTSKDIRCHIGSQLSKDKSLESIERYNNTAEFPASGRRCKWADPPQRRPVSPIVKFQRQNSVHVPDPMVDARNGDVIGRLPRNLTPQNKRDFAVQTDKDLIKFLLPSFRKRGNRSEVSACSNCSVDLKRNALGSETSLSSRTSDEFFLIEYDKNRQSSLNGSSGKDQNLDRHSKQMKEKLFDDDIAPLLPSIVNCTPNGDVFESVEPDDDKRGVVAPVKRLPAFANDQDEASPLLAPPQICSSRSTPSFASIEDNNQIQCPKPKRNGLVPDIQTDKSSNDRYSNSLPDSVDIPTKRYLNVTQALIGQQCSTSSCRSTPVTEDDQLSCQSFHALDREEDSVYEFQEYLKSNGIDLDLNAVQTSDV